MATANLAYSNYSAAHSSTFGAGAVINNTGHNQTTTPPVFVNAAGQDFHQAASSAGTLGLGVTDPANGPLDFEGDQRSIGGLTDIGADQFVTAPTVAPVAASAITQTTATIGGTVNPNGGASSAVLEYGPTTAYGKVTQAQALGNGTAVVPVSASLTGLAPNTTYHFRVDATSSGGTSQSSDQTFTTAAGPTPLPPTLVPPSNAFSVGTKKVSKTGVITLTVQTHAAGKLSGTATFVETIKRTTGHGRHRHTHTTHKKVTYGSATATTNGTTITQLTIKPTSTAKKLLKQLKTLHVSITLVFTPTGGTPHKTVLPVKVTAPKTKKAKHRRH